MVIPVFQYMIVRVCTMVTSCLLEQFMKKIAMNGMMVLFCFVFKVYFCFILFCLFVCFDSVMHFISTIVEQITEINRSKSDTQQAKYVDLGCVHLTSILSQCSIIPIFF